MTLYPIEIDSSLNLPEAVDAISAVNAQAINRLREAIIAIETELGVKPSNVHGTVRERLDALTTNLETLNEALLGVGDGGTVFVPGGDLGGNGVLQNVIGLRGRPLSATAPSTGDAYVWNGTQWAPGAAASASVQTGRNYGAYLDVASFPNITTTDLNIFTSAATINFNPALLTAANGTRTIKLRVIGVTTTPLMTIQLFNVTTNTVVAGSTITTTASTAAVLESGDLSAALSVGAAIYEIQIKMAAGSPTDRVTLNYGSLRVEWS